ncbi:putative hydrolase YxeP [Sodalis glossinidius str. 'morsitans']|uniref:Hydrolase n=1 Tax=Sodalis glossinidius (strain morsitans) TaxID=343509 RepID=Q2NS56_SODGM|nr:M20 aminoacylase family protein [Sodalis glossinidius]BAE75019.1 putative hydrolase [Sodalis glossinidius str. 'morsitans']CRL45915.1 putative hydrolase YxeP [Sodalis glossinidius str. 'morsitans']
MTPPLNGATVADLSPWHDELIALRHHFHQHPELAFEEHHTAATIARQPGEYSYQVTTGVAGTGGVSTLRLGDANRAIGLRADMDALPISEENTFDYQSSESGKMHACGHDGHMTMLLGAARYLAATRRFNGTLHVIFQPAEERGFDSGAQRMVAEGLFDRFPCDAVFAMHNHPGRPCGQLMSRRGQFMAAGDRVFITVRGMGGYAARPHLAQDPVVGAASIIMALQTVVARNVPPDQTAVITIGMLQGGKALNVIPAEVQLRLSVRSFDGHSRAAAPAYTDIVQLQSASLGLSAEINYIEGYPVVCNSEAETSLALQVAAELVGEDKVDGEMDLLTGSEDFAYMLQASPGCLIRISNGEAQANKMLHNPGYDFNDNNLVLGAAYWSRLVERYLPPRTPL